MEQLLEFRFGFDLIRLIEIDYCPAQDKAVKYFVKCKQTITQRKMPTKLHYKKKHSIVHEYFWRSDDAQASKCNIYNIHFI